MTFPVPFETLLYEPGFCPNQISAGIFKSLIYNQKLLALHPNG